MLNEQASLLTGQLWRRGPPDRLYLHDSFFPTD
jgi:hypothetical protein